MMEREVSGGCWQLTQEVEGEVILWRDERIQFLAGG
jgi:hypothetical protein